MMYSKGNSTSPDARLVRVKKFGAWATTRYPSIYARALPSLPLFEYTVLVSHYFPNVRYICLLQRIKVLVLPRDKGSRDKDGR